MRSRFASAFTALVFLSSCTAGAPPSTWQSAINTSRVLTPVGIVPGAQHYGDDWVFSAQPLVNNLSVYRRTGFTLTHKRTLTKGVSAPQGTVTTVNGWWYVSNAGHSNVLIYRTKKRGPTDSPVGTLDDFGQIPVNISVTPERNLVAVSNGMTTGGGPGSVSIYLNRQAEPSRTLTYGSDRLQGEGVAIDHQGNCFWSFNDPKTGTGSVVKFVDCRGSGSVVVPVITNAGGVVFDQHDDLFYVDQASGVYRCNKTSQCALTYGGFGDPTNLNFDYKEKALWVADATGYIDAIDLKTGYIYKFPSVDGDPYGIAPEPGD